jgi:predicted ArsR family transcriptional regulator
MDTTARTVRTLLASLVKAALMSEDRASALWREEAAQAQARLRAEPEAAAALTLDGLWSLAVREAEAPDLREAEGRVSFGLPASCPFTRAALTDPRFDVDAAVERIRKSAATG